MKSAVKYSVVALITVLAATSLSFYQFKSDKKDNHGRFVPKTIFVFGPKMFVRPSGKPVTKVEKFSVPEGVTEPFTIDVLNGFSIDRDHDWNWYRGRRDDDRDMRDRGKKSMVTSATVKLNGIVVLSPSDFGNPTLRDKKHEILITKPVSPNLSGTNTLEVTVEGKPGSFIFLAVTGTKGSTADTTKPQLTLNNGQSTITNEQSVTVSGTVTDQSAVTVTVNGSAVPVSNGSFSTSVNLVEGTNEITVVATDASGNQTTETITVIRDSTPPTLTVDNEQLTVTNQQSIVVSGTVADSTSVTLTVNGQSEPISNGAFSTTVNLVEGVNTITVVATDAAGNTTTVIRHITLYTVPPSLVITSINDRLITNHSQIQIAGTVSDSFAVTVGVNGSSVPVTDGSFSTTISLVEGMNTITIVATDAAGNKTTVTKTVRLDTVPPELTVIEPSDNFVTNDTSITVWGTITDSTGETVTVNGLNVPVDPDTFRTTVHLFEGTNAITIIATDGAGNTTTVSKSVRRYTTPPAITIQSPNDGTQTGDSSIVINGRISDSTDVTLKINGNAVVVNSDGSFSCSISLIDGVNQITISATDAAGNTSTSRLNITRINIVLPPEPAKVAPKIDPTVVTTVGAATKFLYTGSNPIQTGVDTSMMNEVRAAVIRGRVLSRDNQPLPGVTVSILNHPEFGQTLSRKDGMYDMAINGGGQLNVNFTKAGFLTSQRQVNTPWQSYANVEDVVLVQLDPNVTLVKLGGDSISVARGSVITDEDGTRQATLLFKPGTQATMKVVHYAYQPVSLSCNSMQLIKVPTDTETVPLDSLSVRATEYTVGPNGPEAMPALLPPMSGYTYCVELSADEAIASGVDNVQFSKPVAYYIENFLGFPAGTVVPTGYYDKNKGQWIAVRDGIVLKILDTSNGIASIDLDGDGIAESRSVLDSIGLDSLEQMKLASLYQPGQTLWRVTLGHFSPSDMNYATTVNGSGTTDPKDLNGPNQKGGDCSKTGGSIIEVRNQTLGENLTITGTPLVLSYNSGNVPGFKEASRLTLPLTADTLPQGIRRIKLDINVAGQNLFSGEFAPSPDLTTQLIWDRKDAYGRSVQGAQIADVSIGYVYGTKQVLISTLWADTSNFGQSGAYGDITWDTKRGEFISTLKWQTSIGIWDAHSDGLGGWELDAHHNYDLNAKKIYLGNGEERDATLIGPIAVDVQGTSGDGDSWIAIAPDGTMYFTESTDNQVWKRCPDGTITLVAGTGEGGYSGDGGVATEATLSGPSGLAVGSDGSLYIADSWNSCVRKVDPFGIITTFAGTGVYGYSEDGTLAVNAQLLSPIGIAIGPEGNLYIADADCNQIRMVNPAGILSTIAGTGEAGLTGDGGSSLSADLNYPTGVDVDNQGNIFIADRDNQVVRKVTPQGVISTIAGIGWSSSYGGYGDGGPATDAALWSPTSVTVGRDGAVYVDDYTDDRVRLVSPDGIISTYAGGGSGGVVAGIATRNGNAATLNDFQSGDNTNGMMAAGSCFGSPNGSAISPDGTLYFSATGGCGGGIIIMNERRVFPLLASVLPMSVGDDGSTMIYQVKPPFPGMSETESIIASEDGSEVYVFDKYGKHLKTLDALTGVQIYTFTYDTLGLLSSIIDRDKLATTIKRAIDGTPLAIISPYGQATTLGIDTTGYLTSVIDPGGDTSRYTYTADGLMISFKDARDNTHTFAYDSLGRLTYDRDPAGGYKVLTREDRDDGYSVALSTALGNKSIYGVSALPTGGQILTMTDASGLTDTTTYSYDGTWTTISHDGTVTYLKQGPDPRFGMQSPIIAERDVYTQNHWSETQESRTITQMNGLQIGQLTDNVYVNGRNYQTDFFGGGGYATNGDSASGLFIATSPQGRQSFTFIDTLGKVVEDSIPGIVPVFYRYDAKGRLSSVVQGTRTSYFTYDSLGRISLAKDPIGHTSGFAYDSVGRVTTQVLPDGRVITFTYDPNGNLITLTPPGRPEHMFDYNVNDMTDKYTPPFAGDSLRFTRYGYDLDKRLTTTNLPDGRNVTITYDTAGCGCGGTADRIRSIGFDRGTQTFAYDSVGLLSLSVTPERDSLQYTYDCFLPYTMYSSGTVNGNVHYDMDDNLQLIHLQLDYNGVDPQPGETDSFHNILGYDYDSDGLLVGIYQPTGWTYSQWWWESPYWTSDDQHYLTINRDFQTGNITSTSLGNVSTEQTYDNYGGLASYEADYGSTPMFQTTYSRDSLGRITSDYETVFGVSKQFQYSYDAVGRLEKVWRNDTLFSQYVYDANGNRIAHITPTSIDSGAYDAQDRMLSYAGTEYFYTANGDLQTKIAGTDTTRYAYDAFGNLMTVNLPSGDRIDYVVDGQNRRIAKKVNGRIVDKWLYAGQLTPVAELDSANDIIARFSGGYMNKRDTIYQIITDHLGSPKLVVNVQTGIVVQKIDYDEFGNVTFDSNPGFQPFGFAGGLYDTETKLVRFGVRDYDAETGRWTSKDPIGFGGRQTGLYNYVSNNPIQFIDESGLGHFGKRPLSGLPWIPLASSNPIDNYLNTEISHEHFFFDDGSGDNVGFGPHGRFSEDPSGKDYRYDNAQYDDALMREALKNVQDGEYSNWPWNKDNCQDWADRLRKEYNKLKAQKDKKNPCP
jgi:RHS repeat-associated protein